VNYYIMDKGGRARRRRCSMFIRSGLCSKYVVLNLSFYSSTLGVGDMARNFLCVLIFLISKQLKNAD
jgi:hypothetical protein